MKFLNGIKYVTALGVVTISCSVIASPYGDSDVLFGCFIKGKTTKEVAVLRNNNEITYLFGKSDINGGGGVIPEITLVKNVSQLSQSWNYSRAEGVSIHTLNIPENEYTYSISYIDDGKNTDGEITILKQGKEISTIKCDDIWEQHLGDSNMMHGIPDEHSDNINEYVSNKSNSKSEKIPSQSPVKIKIEDTTYNFKGNVSAEHTIRRHVYVYGLKDSVTITGLSIDRGSCYRWNTRPVTLGYGKGTDFSLVISQKVAYANSGWNWIEMNNQYSKCMWSEVEVKTDMGNYTFNLTM
ncbi:hypothetical protein HV314_04310 [Citrobacter sp. RHBSTW-00887]|uniref:hypothetical protein n=1 Tax=Citrobacter sp. RHBSTW-00887 TaxID=2742668 RepID=UPI0015EAD994|nr:hypothetical protein [Citrobacter sp. RHBSTW-00887]QLS53418.1 hypothetical protein HV314_04310 [Citrobacter sp. RHBSTW-00887]